MWKLQLKKPKKVTSTWLINFFIVSLWYEIDFRERSAVIFYE